ncbi:DUF1840 domain-containing protein [Legionella taurinensis]|uniref:DUF1840 domain-containing protein n=1 Tax=Legionella taurinensis TaxID=70611 RepID=A0A3A5LHY5_9GAMM|nr:DUF1840 domain-containing protein [Legionella taurinensis]MDX1837861.1 DUF1840 domain-containing protein [Legionella taurinensis]PUT39637.1 DUF1840 domain-containing protein [Legionella taurinensis]PUT43332.1 DUF1840 domain-containing protein [Legionella taurinensis]PUT45777.1 DUF1840 domain-containing protein [Legionella taurinensis]PUT47689.1 DUF1840 domain-containing protein [Legionella taurinensis]
MLVKFKSDAYENITMLGDIAQRLLKMMGHSGIIPGALVADEIPEALDHLKEAIDRETQKQPLNPEDDDDQVSLANRAYPLVQLLTAAVKKNCNVRWDKV